MKKLEPRLFRKVGVLFSISDFKLLWYCDRYRNQKNDLRNQLMHNLRGVESGEVIDYLLVDKNHTINDVMSADNNHVKEKFLNAINYFKLPYKREKLTKKL